MYTVIVGLRDTAEAVIIAVVLFVALQLATQSYVVEGRSMSPTLVPEQRIMVNRFVYARDGGLFGENVYLFGGPQRGEVIVFVPPLGAETEFVKRVIGVPGDEVTIADGSVIVNGEVSAYVDEPTYSQSLDYPLVVPPNRYFVLGDNRDMSSDSRRWGLVNADDVAGRVWFTYWPFDSFRMFR